MFIYTRLSLRRKAGAHVLKYLEGVPTPHKLIDHLAGADLSSSPHVEFFTTVPRFINYNVEQRLSKLFFHHVLYPAGGARMPYQPVVIRNGRCVRVSATYKLHVTKNPCGLKFNETDFVQATRELSTQMQKTTREQNKIVKNVNTGSTKMRSSSNTSTILGKVSSSPLDVVEDNANFEMTSNSNSNSNSNNNDNENTESSPKIQVTEIVQDSYQKFSSSPVSAHVPWSRYDVARRPFFVSPRLSKSNAFHHDPGTRTGRYTIAEPLFKIYKTNEYNRSVMPLRHRACERNLLQKTLQNLTSNDITITEDQHEDISNMSSKATFINQHNSIINIYDNASNNVKTKNEYDFVSTDRTKDNAEKVYKVHENGDRQRSVCDWVLTPLCTVVNEYFNEKCVLMLEFKERLAQHNMNVSITCRPYKLEEELLLLEERQSQQGEHEMEDGGKGDKENRKIVKKSFPNVEQSIANLMVNESGGVLCARINSESGKAELVESHFCLKTRYNSNEKNVKVEASNGDNVNGNITITKDDNNNHCKKNEGKTTNSKRTLQFIIAEYVKHALEQRQHSMIRKEEWQHEKTMMKKNSNSTDSINTFCHVMTSLPPRAVVAVPMTSSCFHKKSAIINNTTFAKNCSHGIQEEILEEPEEFICRLAGGVEPHVPFAVGRTKGCRISTSDVNLDDAKSKLFAHINCLLRINVHASASVSNKNSDKEHEGTDNFTSSTICHGHHATLTESNLQESYENKNRQSRVEERYSFEPWRLGVALDPLLPYQIRTVHEHDNLANSNDYRKNKVTLSGLNFDGNDDTEVMEGVSRVSSEQHEQNENLLPLMLGRCDAETYLIPQHELIVTLYVPPQTQRMCKEQNIDRLRLQVELGHVPKSYLALDKMYRNEMEKINDDNSSNNKNGDNYSGININDDVAWSRHAKLTASRLAKGRLANIECAENESNNGNSMLTHKNTSFSEGSDNNKQNAPCANVLEKFTSHKVRVLPGDVLYIPRNWGYRVHRIVGSAVYGVDESLNKITKPQILDNKAISWPHQSSHFDGGISDLLSHENTNAFENKLESGALQHQQRKTDGNIHDCRSLKEAWNFAVSSVDVDAFCISYQSYPQLTKEQASVYVAANYVTRGIDEFYDHGGNAVYHKYEERK